MELETAQATYEHITSHLADGGVVVIGTYAKAIQFDGPKFVDSFRVNGSTCEMRQGRSWVAITIAGRPCVGIRRARWA